MFAKLPREPSVLINLVLHVCLSSLGSAPFQILIIIARQLNRQIRFVEIRLQENVWILMCLFQLSLLI
jgi:hypothetical protein